MSGKLTKRINPTYRKYLAREKLNVLVRNMTIIITRTLKFRHLQTIRTDFLYAKKKNDQ